MARANPNRLDNAAVLSNMDRQSLRAILARTEAVSQRVRELLSEAAPGREQQSLPPTSNTAEDAPAIASGPASSQSTDGDSENATNADSDSAALETDAGKALVASPAATDDVPAMTQGEKTPVQGDQSPAAPLEEDLPVVERVNLPHTPTKATAGAGDGLVVLESHGDADKALVDEEGRMDIG